MASLLEHVYEEETQYIRRSPSSPSRRATDIALRVTLDGDTRRVFQAVTVPEFREAWICEPHAGSESRVIASESADSYQLNFYREGNLYASVSGAYQIARRHKLIFTWCNRHSPFVSSSPFASSSKVRIRIEGYFQRSILALYHTDIANEEESRWLTEMWGASLNKLTTLFAVPCTG